MKTKHHVLFIDDELELIEGYRDFFEPEFHMATASSVKEGLEKMRAQEFSVVLVDMCMPGESGADFLAIANQEFKRPIKIVLSAFVSDFFDDRFQTRYRPYATVRKAQMKPFALLALVQEAAQEYEYRYGKPDDHLQEEQRYLSTHEVLKRLSISKPTLYKYLKEGLPSQRLGGRRLFNWVDITDWIKKKTSHSQKNLSP